MAWTAILIIASGGNGCRRDGSESGRDPPPALPGASAAVDGGAKPATVPSVDGDAAPASPRHQAFAPPRGGERIPLPGGSFHAGSLPGDDGRDPRLEPPAFEVTLGPYEMDRLPYPNNPAEHPRTEVSREDAARLCHERGERLCTELEWERACKGSQDDTYADGDAWDSACAHDLVRCPSAFGLLGMGTLREWTASDLVPLEKGEKYRPIARGASADAERTDHRCAHRIPQDPLEHARDLGFRCCQGPPNAAVIPASKSGPAFRRATIEPKQLSEIFAGIPQLARVKDSIRFFIEPDDVTAVLRRGGETDTGNFTLTVGPLLWNPIAGDEVLVITGRTKKDAFIAALYRLPGERYRLASSMIFADDTGPFALAYNPYVRERLQWSSCWKCSGEGGAIALREERRVVIVQQ